MATITVEIEDSKAIILREKARKSGLLPDQFVTASIEDLISQPDPDFETAMRKVLSKNKELYKRSRSNHLINEPYRINICDS